MNNNDIKIAHVCNYAPGLSGMYGTVKDLMLQERETGFDAQFIDDSKANVLYGTDEVTPVPINWGDQADIICWHHAMVEDWFNEPHRNIVLFLHGTPEYNFQTEMTKSDRVLSLIIGASKMNIAKGFISMWRRHVPIWEGMLGRKVHYVPPWTDLNAFYVSQKKVDPNVIRIGMMDYWRLSREPFGLFNALNWVKNNTDKKIEINVWGLVEQPNKTYLAIIQNMIADGQMTLHGNTKNPMGDIYHQNDMILTMSSEETRVVREGYSCGVPIVCGHSHLDFTNYCAESINAEMLGQQILQCHEDLCKDEIKIRKGLRSYAESEFDVKRSANKIEGIFKEIIKEHGSVNYPKLHNGIRMVESVHVTADKVRDRLINNEPIAYLRNGDGELLFMSNQIQKGGFHNNSPELSKEITEAFNMKDDGWMTASAAGIINEGRMRKGLFGAFGCDQALIDIVNKNRPNETLPNYIALAYKSVFEPKWFIDFLKRAIHPRNVLFVGGETLCQNKFFKKAFNIKTTISLPMQNAYQKLNEMMPKIEEEVKKHDLLILAAGMTANVIAKRLWKDNLKIDTIDIGSIADAFCEIKNTRTWIKMVSDTYLNNYKAIFEEKQSIDIVVLSHGQEDKTISCFESIAKYTDNYRVIWVDNGSSDESIEKVKPYAKKLKACDFVKNKTNEGFAKGVNKALRKILYERSSNYIVLLNNDVIVTDRWADKLITSMTFNEYDVIGPLTSENNPHSIDALKVVKPELPDFDQESIDERANILYKKFGNEGFQSGNMLSFFCCMMKRVTIEHVGLLDENIFAYGEDNDYFERMKRIGKRFGINFGCYVHHDHHATSSTMGDDWIREQRDKSVAYLKEKYKNAPAINKER